MSELLTSNGETTMPHMERRTFAGAVEIRAEGDTERLVGVGLRFGSLSDDMGGWRERFAAHAFDESLGTDDVKVIWQHDGKHVFGRVRRNTAKVVADEESLRYEATPPNAQWARDALESVRRGDVDQNSFAFMVAEPRDKNQTFEQGPDGIVIRTILKARLFEVGPQTFPAYPDTSVALRGRAHVNDAEVVVGEIAEWRSAQEAAAGTADQVGAAQVDLLRKTLDLDADEIYVRG
jgi:HK97 family phage prohead protease